MCSTMYKLCVPTCPSNPSHLYILPPQLPLHGPSTTLEVPGIHIEALCSEGQREGGREGRREGGREGGREVGREGGRKEKEQIQRKNRGGDSENSKEDRCGGSSGKYRR